MFPKCYLLNTDDLEITVQDDRVLIPIEADQSETTLPEQFGVIASVPYDFAVEYLDYDGSGVSWEAMTQDNDRMLLNIFDQLSEGIEETGDGLHSIILGDYSQGSFVRLEGSDGPYTYQQIGSQTLGVMLALRHGCDLLISKGWAMEIVAMINEALGDQASTETEMTAEEIDQAVAEFSEVLDNISVEDFKRETE